MKEPFAAGSLSLVQSTEDHSFLKDLSERRKYRYMTIGTQNIHWLEWRTGTSIPVRDPSEYFKDLTPFVPFAYPDVVLEFGESPSIPHDTFLIEFYGERGGDQRSELQKHLSAYRSKLESEHALDEQNRVKHGTYGWLIQERDAQRLQINRCAERLISPTTRNGNRSPFEGILNALKVWAVEHEISHLGESISSAVKGRRREKRTFEDLSDKQKYQFLDGRHYIQVLWEAGVLGGIGLKHFAKQGNNWIGNLFRFGVPEPVAIGTAGALIHYLQKRDLVLIPAARIGPRWYAAEIVLHRALTGEPLDEVWEEDVVRAEAVEKREVDAEMYETLLINSERLRYIDEVLYPKHFNTGGWPAISGELKAHWKKAGLSDDKLPYNGADPDVMNRKHREYRKRISNAE